MLGTVTYSNEGVHGTEDPRRDGEMDLQQPQQARDELQTARGCVCQETGSISTEI